MPRGRPQHAVPQAGNGNGRHAGFGRACAGGDAGTLQGRVRVPCCDSWGLFASSEQCIEARSGKIGNIFIYDQSWHGGK